MKWLIIPACLILTGCPGDRPSTARQFNKILPIPIYDVTTSTSEAVKLSVNENVETKFVSNDETILNAGVEVFNIHTTGPHETTISMSGYLTDQELYTFTVYFDRQLLNFDQEICDDDYKRYNYQMDTLNILLNTQEITKEKYDESVEELKGRPNPVWHWDLADVWCRSNGIQTQ